MRDLGSPRVAARRTLRASGADDVRGVAKHLKVRVVKQRLGKNSSLSALCIPLSRGQLGYDKGWRYRAVIDVTHGYTEPFLIGHELAHVVSNTFGVRRTQEIEDWCDAFGVALCKLTGEDPGDPKSVYDDWVIEDRRRRHAARAARRR